MKTIEQYTQDGKSLLQRLGSTPRPLTMDSISDAIVRYAYVYVGLSEIDDTNRNALIDAWCRELRVPLAQPWCITYIQHVFYAVSKALNMPDLLPLDTASSQRLADSAEHEGLATIVTSEATAASIIIYRDGDKPIGHGEIITHAEPAVYDSIGGNTNSEHSRDGGDVGTHIHVPWAKFGPVGSMRRGKRWTRCIIPLPRLVHRYWDATIA